jgi:hypothetical protein
MLFNEIIFKIIFIFLYAISTYSWINATNSYLLYKRFSPLCIKTTLCMLYLITSTGLFISYFYGNQIFIACGIIYTIVSFVLSGIISILTKTHSEYNPLE